MITTLVTATIFTVGVVSASAVSPVKVLVNGQEINSDVPAQIVDGRTLVPVRAISEALQADVEWDETTSTAYISTEGAEEKAKEKFQAELRREWRQDFSQWQRLSSATFVEILEQLEELEDLTITEKQEALEEILQKIDEEILAQASTYRIPPRHSKVNYDFLEGVLQVRSGSALLQLATEEMKQKNDGAAKALTAAAEDFFEQIAKTNRFVNMDCMECHTPPGQAQAVQPVLPEEVPSDLLELEVQQEQE
ncbi:copper amine oxidase N-terminal domain-containing protein [Heliorestis acidaminivorans]|uniref:Copper amine oxidase N-terminal domain-containing protein n=2 Tax=Heliorestis acidaminivorans TaxID=553427 RepID=A0A6I0F5A5_9FIRM|nr:copper amine oxidase N-terminal domain-containing protein [Heliorestis acidaminivorans]